MSAIPARSSERELQSLTQGGIAYSQQAVLQTPIMCRLHARYPELGAVHAHKRVGGPVRPVGRRKASID